VDVVTRLVKSAHNRARLLAVRARGVVTRALRPGLLGGAHQLGVGRNVELVIYGELVLGSNVSLSDGCSLHVGPRGRLTIGDRVFVGRHSVIAADESVEIGRDTLIAEHCTIRDQDHHLVPEERMREVATTTSPVRVAENVWIGAGVRVLKGAQIGEGAMVAANAVVKGVIPARVVAGGIPAQVLRSVGPAAQSRLDSRSRT
jgi:carbonic anhydrase/acetyltransferase-like protein (isoleucine patch superfamily)